MKRFHNWVGLRIVVLALSATFVVACGSNAINSNAPNSNTPGVTPANSSNTNTPVTTTPDAGAANANQQPTQAAARPDCGTCWVQVFDDKNFKVTDDHHLICGPGKWPNLRNLPGAVKINWGDEIESLKVGPGATVIVWIGEQYTGMSQTFGPGTENPNLKQIPGLGDQISSLEIRCQ
jgi:hypothetical protein